jgi:hypothetical protein
MTVERDNAANRNGDASIASSGSREAQVETILSGAGICGADRRRRHRRPFHAVGNAGSVDLD